MILMRAQHDRPIVCMALATLMSVAMSVGALAEDIGCAIEPSRHVKLSTAVEGVLASVKVQRGDRVREGDVVALLESGVEQAAEKLADGRATLHAQIDARQARLKSAGRKLKRTEELVDKNFVSLEEVEDAQTEFEVAERNLQEAIESQQLAKLDLVRAKEQLALRVIRSPINGIVVETFLSGGEFAQGQPIMEMVAIDPLHVEVLLPLSMYGQITNTSVGIVTPEAPLTGEYPAKVAIIDKVVDAASGTYGVRLLLPNPEYALPAGIECEVRFDHGE
jgi:membrane fusion protein, multidrug efflux system